MAESVDPDLEAAADQKRESVQEFIRCLEKAVNLNGAQDREWLQRLTDRENPCFATLIKCFTEPKYHGFLTLRCVALRAVQMTLQIAIMTVQGRTDHNVGLDALFELAGEELAHQAIQEAVNLAEQVEHPIAATNAMMVLAELGPEALYPELVPRVVELLEALPGRADDLSQVSLRIHAWGGEARGTLLNSIVAHPGGKLLCEVLLQMVNRCDLNRRFRALKIFVGCMGIDGSEGLMYTNDARILVEILLREMPNHTEDLTAFRCHAECYKALLFRYEVARSHRKEEATQVFQDIRDAEGISDPVRAKCSEVLALLEGYS